MANDILHGIPFKLDPLERAMEILPAHYFDDLPPEKFDERAYVDSPGFTLEHHSHTGRLRIATQRRDSDGQIGYHSTITDNDVLVRAGCMQSPLEVPGYILSAASHSDFGTAIGKHFAALHDLYARGY